jgi:hypothetical protein
MLVAATYAFLRKRSKQGGVALVAAAAILGATYLTDESWAVAPNTFTISTPAGSAFVSCNINDIGSAQQGLNGIAEIVVGTTLQEGVVLRRVDPSFPVPTSAGADAEPTVMANMCSVGLRVTPAASCTLPCALD